MIAGVLLILFCYYHSLCSLLFFTTIMGVRKKRSAHFVEDLWVVNNFLGASNAFMEL